jgi:hypothetical protein
MGMHADPSFVPMTSSIKKIPLDAADQGAWTCTADETFLSSVELINYALSQTYIVIIFNFFLINMQH